MERTTATPEQVAEAMRVNTGARLRALKIGFVIMAGLALLSIIPAGRLPQYRPGELPSAPAPQGATPAEAAPELVTEPAIAVRPA